MKRFVSVLLCFIMLFCLTSVCFAEEGNFTVTGIEVSMLSNGNIQVLWGNADPVGAYLSAITVDDQNLSIISAGNGSICEAIADGSPLGYGNLGVSVQFAWPDSSQTYFDNGYYVESAGGTSDIHMSGSVSGDIWVVKCTDDWGKPIEGVPISYDIDNNYGVHPGATYSDGTVTLSLNGLTDGAQLVCRSADYSTPYVDYTGSECTLTYHNPNATTVKTTRATTVKTTVATTEAPEEDEEESEDEEDESSTDNSNSAELPTLPADANTEATLPTYKIVTGNTTTKVKDDFVYSDLMADTKIIEQSGISIKDFNKKGRLGLSKEDYDLLIKTYGGTMFGLVTTTAYPDVTKQLVEEHKKGEAFKKCNTDNCQILTFGLGLRFIQSDKQGLTVTDLSDLEANTVFEFQIPVPDSMKKCKTFGIAMTAENIITDLTQVKADKGVITFRTSYLGYYTLVGFKEGEKPVAAPISPLKILVFVLFAVGILALLAMCFFIFWFYIRPKFATEDEYFLFGQNNEDDELATALPEESSEQEEPIEESSEQEESLANVFDQEENEEPVVLEEEEEDVREYIPNEPKEVPPTPQNSGSGYDVDDIISQLQAERGPSASETIEADGEDIFGLNKH